MSWMSTAIKTANLDHKGHDSILTLWSCASCGSFVSIESLQPVHAAVCPACQGTPLNLCGTFEDILNMHGEHDPCGDYYS